MAFVLSHLSEFPTPQRGERTAVLRLDSNPQSGYRVRATAHETGRDIGRFMSDCPLSVCQAALLWINTHEWEVAEADDSAGIEQVLQSVERPTPMAPPPGVHVRDILDILMRNLPPREEQVPAAMSGIRRLGGGSSAPAQQPRQLEDRRARPREREISPEARELGGFLKEARKMLADGIDPAEVDEMLAEYVRSQRQGGGPQHEGFAPGMQPMVMSNGGLRPLLPGEVPPGLSDDQQRQLQGMTAGSESVRQRVVSGVAHDREKYLANVPPLTPQQRREVELARQEMARARKQPEPEPEEEEEAGDGDVVVDDEGNYFLIQGDDLIPLEVGEDGQILVPELELEPEPVRPARRTAPPPPPPRPRQPPRLPAPPAAPAPTRPAAPQIRATRAPAPQRTLEPINGSAVIEPEPPVAPQAVESSAAPAVPLTTSPPARGGGKKRPTQEVAVPREGEPPEA